MAGKKAAKMVPRARWSLALGLLVVGLLAFAAILWLAAGGLRDLGAGDEWVAALGSEDGMQNVAVLAVGAATILAGGLFLLMLSFQDDTDDLPLMFLAAVGAALLIADGVILWGIGWVAVPFLGQADFAPDDPFVKTIELLMIVRASLGFLGGALIGIFVAASAMGSMRHKRLPAKMALAGLVSGVLAVFGGALILVGLGATVQSLGLVSSVAWSGTRSLMAVRMATRQGSEGQG